MLREPSMPCYSGSHSYAARHFQTRHSRLTPNLLQTSKLQVRNPAKFAPPGTAGHSYSGSRVKPFVAFVQPEARNASWLHGQLLPYQTWPDHCLYPHDTHIPSRSVLQGQLIGLSNSTAVLGSALSASCCSTSCAAGRRAIHITVQPAWLTGHSANTASLLGLCCSVSLLMVVGWLCTTCAAALGLS